MGVNEKRWLNLGLWAMHRFCGSKGVYWVLSHVPGHLEGEEEREVVKASAVRGCVLL